ncbi:hypothetical protein NDK25_09645 [Niallia taxi]|nr:hypothetical protein [Niallia taxi]MDE5052515.1 hypothetical protein [Niallia taxi]
MVDYKNLNKKYLIRKHKLTFTKDQVIERVKRKYGATEFQKEELLDLVNDDQLDYNKITLCLSISNANVLSKVFTEEEKADQQEQVIDNIKFPLSSKKIKKDEYSYNQILVAEQEGKRINIILESKDNKYISEFLVRGNSMLINRYLNAMIVGSLLEQGTAEYEADLNDDYFQFYLENLDMFGLLK